MADVDLKILLKTVADRTGLSRISRGLAAQIKQVNLLRGAYRGLRKVGGGAMSMLRKEMRGVRNTAIAATAALAGTVREGVKFNVPLAQAVNMFSGNKLKNFVKFRKELLDISSAYGIARSELMKPLYQGGSAQMEADDVFAAIRKSAQGVIADGAELTDVMSGIIAGQKSFGGEVEETAEMLYRMVQLGQTTFGEVGQYLNQVGPIAQANKVPLEEIGGAIAQLTSKTIPLSRSVNMLRNIMTKLNVELGDGWHETRNLQEAMEEVARTNDYSQAKLAKSFGLENLSAVAAMTGENFEEAKKQLNAFEGDLNGLANASKFTDQFRSWAKIWQTIRSMVTEIGSALEQRWAPRIAFIHEKLNDLRKGKGFKEMVDSIAEKMERSVTWVVSQIMTAKDLVDHLKDADFGLGKAAQIGATVVQELVTMAVTLLAAQLRALLGVLTGMAKTIAAVFAEELAALLQDTPLFKGAMNQAALGKLNAMSFEDEDAFRKQQGLDWNANLEEEMRRGNLRPSDILGFKNVAAVDRALKDTAKDLKAAFKQVSDQWDKSTERMDNAVTRATGGGFDWSSEASANRQNIENWGKGGEGFKSPGQIEREVEKHLDKLADLEEKLRAARSKRSGALSARQEVGEYEAAKSRYQDLRGDAPDNLSPYSFSAKRISAAREKMEKEKAEAEDAVKKAGSTVEGLSKMLTTFANKINTLESQISNLRSEM